MKALVVGLGSMGKRRINLIRQNYPQVELIGTDTNETRCNDTQKQFGIKCFVFLDEAITEKPDCSFVCTSPLSHEAIIRQLLNNGIHVFTEINLIGSYYDEMTDLASKNHVKLFLSSTFLYRRDIQKLISLSKEDKAKKIYQYHVGQYLPDWHPWEKVANYFISDKRTNGIREILAIDLPWIFECFGSIDEAKCIHAKESSLDLPYDDSFAITARHHDGTIGTILVDVISRNPERRMQIQTENQTLLWEGNPEYIKQYLNGSWQKINVYDKYVHDDRYASNIIEDAYTAEIAEYFEYIHGNVTKPSYSFEKDKIVLGCIDKIEKSI